MRAALKRIVDELSSDTGSVHSGPDLDDDDKVENRKRQKPAVTLTTDVDGDLDHRGGGDSRMASNVFNGPVYNGPVTTITINHAATPRSESEIVQKSLTQPNLFSMGALQPVPKSERVVDPS